MSPQVQKVKLFIAQRWSFNVVFIHTSCPFVTPLQKRNYIFCSLKKNILAYLLGSVLKLWIFEKGTSAHESPSSVSSLTTTTPTLYHLRACVCVRSHVAQVSLHGDTHVARPAAAATEDPGCVIGSLRCFSEPRSGTSSAKTRESRPTCYHERGRR